MLGSIRKFSTTIYAKILLAIVIIPFVFWGMGNVFGGGNKNIVVVIENEKYSIQQFTNFIKRSANNKIETNQIDGFLSAFISEKIIEKEVEDFEIKLSDESLRKLIKHQKDFKRENKFSRTEYEKFLLKNNITAVNFESILSKQERKKQLLDIIGGGIMPSKFLVNISYDKINQKRNIELINLNDVFENQLNFSDSEVKIYFENNKKKFIETYKSFRISKLSTKNLIDSDEFTDLFFKKVDEIDDLIIRGENLDYIIDKFNLEKPNSLTINKLGKDANSKMNKDISKNFVKKIFNLNDIEPIVLIEDENKYFIIELSKIESIQKNHGDESVKREILIDLNKNTKRKLISEIVDKINKKNFNKYNFDQFAKERNLVIKKISIKNQYDEDILNKDLVDQIYAFPEKKVIVVNDIGLSENFLIYIDKIQHVTIDENSDKYQKYLNISRKRIASTLFNTYDGYLRKRYKIDINYQAVDAVKNYFN
jgi:peptidyl-prolyl cis-trans isomerase D